MDLRAILNNQHKGKTKKRSAVKQLLLLLVVDLEGPIGRYQLKEILDMTEHEGIVRHMLSEFQHLNYLSASQSGVKLTNSGQQYLRNQMHNYHILDIKTIETPFFEKQSLTIGLHLENCVAHITSAMHLRDTAVRGGANGAIIIVYRNNRLTVPSVSSEFLANNPALTQTIQNHFHLTNNDVLILISAETVWRGLEAAILTAQSITEDKNPQTL